MTPCSLCLRKRLEDLAQDVVRECERIGYAPDYTQGILKGLKSWLKHNARELKRDVKIKDLGVPVTLAEETVPEPAQLQEVLSAGTTRAKVSASFIAFSGLRPEVLGNSDGTKGLVLGDLPDLEIEALQFRTIPAQVIVRRELSKVRHQYFTYINEKGCGYLLSYLRDRREAGEPLNPQSPVVAADMEHKRAYFQGRGLDEATMLPFLATANVEAEVRRAIQRGGYEWRPYVLRAYFDSHLLNAELQGRIASSSRAFFMGHRGDIARRYDLNKHRLPAELAQQMKAQYVQGAAFLVSEQLTTKQVEEKIEAVRGELRVKVQEEVKDEFADLRAQLSMLTLVVSKLRDRPANLAAATKLADALPTEAEQYSVKE